MLSALLLLLSINPPSDVVRESVDLIELNAYFDEYGRLVFVQDIFYDWSDSERRYNVRAWRLVKHESQIPRRDHASGGYVVLWQDNDKTTREVRSKEFRETWLQYDPELAEREILPKDLRRGLRGEK